jgi:hypothetical protein
MAVFVRHGSNSHVELEPLRLLGLRESEGGGVRGGRSQRGEESEEGGVRGGRAGYERASEDE